jgi:ribosomal protein S18 acetylase RimI-like enzyme
MSHIQTDVSEAGLITAIRANMMELFQLLSTTSPAENFSNEKFTGWLTPLPHPWFNGVLCHQKPTATDEAFITEAIAYFQDKKVNAFTWWLAPQLTSTDWEPALTARGFGFSNDTPGMAVDLNHLNESAPPVPGLEIRHVNNAEMLQTWAEVFARGYGLPEDWATTIFALWLKFGLEFPMRNYLGYWQGEPVSTSTIFYGGGAAGIYDVATLPAARGQGIGAALTLQPLLEARARGYHIGTLQSSQMGFKIYQKLGFKHVCQIENFYLSSTQH